MATNRSPCSRSTASAPRPSPSTRSTAPACSARCSARRSTTSAERNLASPVLQGVRERLLERDLRRPAGGAAQAVVGAADLEDLVGADLGRVDAVLDVDARDLRERLD